MWLDKVENLTASTYLASVSQLPCQVGVRDFTTTTIAPIRFSENRFRQGTITPLPSRPISGRVERNHTSSHPSELSDD